MCASCVNEHGDGTAQGVYSVRAGWVWVYLNEAINIQIDYMAMSCHMGCLVWFASLECSMIVTDILALADVIIVMLLCHFQRCSIITTHRVFSSHK